MWCVTEFVCIEMNASCDERLLNSNKRIWVSWLEPNNRPSGEARNADEA